MDPWRPSMRVLHVTTDATHLTVAGILDESHDAQAWRFRFLLDTDEDEASGYYGWEFCVDALEGMTDGSVPLRACRRSGIADTLASVRIMVSENYVSFRVPLRALADDGRMRWTYVGRDADNLQSYERSVTGVVGWR